MSNYEDDNVFDIKQSVSINVFVKHSQKIKDKELEDKKLSPSSYKYDFANVYYYDLYGKREYKYKFLFDNNIKSIEWNKLEYKELEYKEPFFLFIPQNDNLLEEYDKFYSIKNMFMIYSIGIVADKKLINNNKIKLKENILNYYNECNEKNIKSLYSYPFDKKYIYYDHDKIERSRINTMEHLLGRDNIALTVPRQNKNDIMVWQSVFILDDIVENCYISTSGKYGLGTVFPLYLYNTPSAKKAIQAENYNVGDLFEKYEENPFDNSDKIENFTRNFRNFIDEKYSSHFSPEDILGYIYAVLFHKTYRTKCHGAIDIVLLLAIIFLILSLIVI